MRRNAARVRCGDPFRSSIGSLGACPKAGALFLFIAQFCHCRARTEWDESASPRAPGGAPPSTPRNRGPTSPPRRRDEFLGRGWCAKFERADSTIWRIQPLFPRLVYVARPVEAQKDVPAKSRAGQPQSFIERRRRRARVIFVSTREREVLLQGVSTKHSYRVLCVWKFVLNWNHVPLHLASLLHLVPAETLVFIIYVKCR